MIGSPIGWLTCPCELHSAQIVCADEGRKSITANDVIQAYQLILGCPPGPGESADEIAAEVTTLQQLRTSLTMVLEAA